MLVVPRKEQCHSQSRAHLLVLRDGYQSHLEFPRLTGADTGTASVINLLLPSQYQLPAHFFEQRALRSTNPITVATARILRRLEPPLRRLLFANGTADGCSSEVTASPMTFIPCRPLPRLHNDTCALQVACEQMCATAVSSRCLPTAATASEALVSIMQTLLCHVGLAQPVKRAAADGDGDAYAATARLRALAAAARSVPVSAAPLLVLLLGLPPRQRWGDGTAGETGGEALLAAAAAAIPVEPSLLEWSPQQTRRAARRAASLRHLAVALTLELWWHNSVRLSLPELLRAVPFGRVAVRVSAERAVRCALSGATSQPDCLTHAERQMVVVFCGRAVEMVRVWGGYSRTGVSLLAAAAEAERGIERIRRSEMGFLD